MSFPPSTVFYSASFAVFCFGAVSAFSAPSAPVEAMIPFVMVGDPQNPDDDETTFGGARDKDLENASVGYVGQVFAIAETEVTNEMYARFLNAVARRDRLYGLYTTKMSPLPAPGGGITRIQDSNGLYSYSVQAGKEKYPVNFVSAFDAMRFCNWLHNGMPGDPQAENPARRTPLTGDQDATSTEDGAYTLLGVNKDQVVRRNAGARYFLPDQDEWHKAAYFDPLPGPRYWWFADRTFTGPGGNFASGGTYQGRSFTAPVAVRSSSSPSHYGTYDQDGNVDEWLDAFVTEAPGRLARYFADQSYVNNTTTGRFPPLPEDNFTVTLTYADADATNERPDLGFRVARPAADAPTVQETIPLAVEVGQPDNLADEEYSPQLGDAQLGAVNYAFQMGAYEVTNLEYARFLNAKAREDSFYRLYDTRMESDAANGGIMRNGANGSYTYTVKAGFSRKPVVYVSIFSAMRYCNWLHNGGRADSDMEAGAYRLLGNIPPNTVNLTRSASARYYLPDADEFYKAAYYDGSGSAAANATFGYWKFATRSDTFNATNNSPALSDVNSLPLASYFGTYGQSGNVGYINPGSGANTAAPAPAAANTGELLEGSANTDDESATKTFRIAAAAGVPALRPLSDEDGDGLPNWWEVLNGSAPLSSDGTDPDGDGLSNARELTLGTEPFVSDTDGDGLLDGAEVDTHRTSPVNADTDNDGLTDGAEIAAGTNPLAFDTTEASPELVAVGLPGNIGNPANGGKGSVVYQLRIGKFEVTNEEYVAFLNSVARTSDVHGLYDLRMGYSFQLDTSDPRNINVTGGIVRTVTGGSMTYSVKRGFGRKPVNFVSYDSALRYCNWLHNRAGAGASTETGAYTMAGTKQRNAGARFWLPNEDEWHKAAAFDASAGDRYWLYSYRSDAADARRMAVSPTGLADVNKPGFSSYFGTFGQSANAAEWIEKTLQGPPALMGGSVLSYAYGDSGTAFASASFSPSTGSAGRFDAGFRVAALPGGSRPQSIVFPAPSRRLAGSGASRIAVWSTSGLPVTFESSDPQVAYVSDGPKFDYVVPGKPGTAVITVRQGGDSTWAPARPVSRTVTVTAPRKRFR